MTEPDWKNLDPRDWPHTPPLKVFLELEKSDMGLWWSLDPGHHLNLFEQALDEAGLME